MIGEGEWKTDMADRVFNGSISLVFLADAYRLDWYQTKHPEP